MSDVTARVLDVGNCDPDHSMIRGMLTNHFAVSIDRVMYVDEALEQMRAGQYDLVLFNRLVFADGSEGIELIRRAKADGDAASLPIMMVSNFTDAQDACEQAGGVRGFGKRQVSEPATIELLSQYLPRKQAPRNGSPQTH